MGRITKLLKDILYSVEKTTYDPLMVCLLEKTEKNMLQWYRTTKADGSYTTKDGDLTFEIRHYNGYEDAWSEITVKDHDNVTIKTMSHGAERLYQILYRREMAPMWKYQTECVDTYLKENC
jgi:hypothetical protein